MISDDNMVLPAIAYYPDPNLSKRTQLVQDFDLAKKIVSNLFPAMIINGGIGLAANQCKIDMRIFVMKTQKMREAFINPKILHSSGEMLYTERCLSFPGVEIPKTRARCVLVEAQDIDGNLQHYELDNLEAIVAQHEIEHLDGYTFIEHLSRLKRKLICQQVQKELKSQRRQQKKT